jgi:triacylglycerol esterase/lipase EstA (alpha/beta hydrolase family)
VRPWMGLAAALTALAVLFGALSAANAALPVGGITDAVWAYAAAPKTVAGANDYSCKPSAAHPRPIVLVHGTAENMGFNWAALSPMLKNAGYCVFALNYGDNFFLSLDHRIEGLNAVASSAKELQVFIDNVLVKTRTTKVDIVGHSQGGMMPNYYLKRLGGASKVGTLVGLAPSNHGTTLSGLTKLGTDLGLLGVANVALNAATPSLVDQEVGSPFQKALFGDGDTVAGPRYVVIETNKDAIVTPYTNAFLSGPNVKNILIQDQCPADGTGHIGLAFDGPALQNVMNVLGPNNPTFKPTCTGYGVGV